MADQGKSAFFDQAQVDKWDARETGQALVTVLGKIGTMNRTNGNTDQIVSQLESSPDALSGLEHIRQALKASTR